MTQAVAALAGRRIDPPDAPVARFPLRRIDAVRESLGALMREQEVQALVCSGACGADLLALDAARRLGIRTRVVLPFGRERFRRTSVIDRPGDWGALFDEIVAAAEKNGDLVELAADGDDDQAYLLATDRIVSEARALAGNGRALAVVVWEGAPRGAGDITEAFRRKTRAAGMDELEIRTT